MHVVLLAACRVEKDCMILKNALITLHFLYIELKAICQYTYLIMLKSGIRNHVQSEHERCRAVGVGPEEAANIDHGGEHLSCKEKLREMGLFSMEMRRV